MGETVLQHETKHSTTDNRIPNKKKHLPILFNTNESCCGCTACYSICPVNAISMCEDEEGFLYPVISAEKCLSCKKCVSVCAFKKKTTFEKEIISLYAVKHYSEEVRRKSRSGGVFTALSDEILNCNGLVYGCVMKDQYTAVHIRAENNSDRNKMRGSKYIQSNLGDCFMTVKEDLIEGRTVLFSGTSCQIDGLKSFLGKEYENLICVDIVCHAVPSKKIWTSFVEWQEKKYGKCISIDFRNKNDFGWGAHIETLIFSQKGKRTAIDSEIFRNLFYGDLISRPSCYNCSYKTIYHPGDITIGDYWGIDKAAPGFSDNRGVSLVIVNTDKGRTLFEAVKKNCIVKETKIEDSMQMPFVESVHRPENRDVFWEDYQKKDFRYIIKKYGRKNWKQDVKFCIRHIRRKLKFKNMEVADE